jgi:formate hydrogenlyase subunit 6/NADH:ubiquinone oxidoreductase subunit I
MNLKTRIYAFGALIAHIFQRPVTVSDTFGFIASASRGLPRRDEDRCTGCGACNERCSSGATSVTDSDSQRTISIDSLRCIFCARCADVCPESALDLRFGPVLSDERKQIGSLETHIPDLEPDWLSITGKDLDSVLSDRYTGLISLSHEIHEKGAIVDTTLTLQICPFCGEVMPVTEKFLQLVAERVLENLQPDTAVIVKKDMEQYLTACISCRRNMSVKWNTHPRKFI